MNIHMKIGRKLMRKFNGSVKRFLWLKLDLAMRAIKLRLVFVKSRIIIALLPLFCFFYFSSALPFASLYMLLNVYIYKKECIKIGLFLEGKGDSLMYRRLSKTKECRSTWMGKRIHLLNRIRTDKKMKNQDEVLKQELSLLLSFLQPSGR